MKAKLWGVGVLGFALALAPYQALAFVRTLTLNGVAMHWNQTCIDLKALTGNPPPGVTPDLMLQAARAAAAVWSNPGLDCSALGMQVVASPETNEPVQYDGDNVIQFRQDGWCHRYGETSTASTACDHDSAALAITSVWANKNTGRIVDTDVEINAVNFTWGDVVANPRPQDVNIQDLQNALTHEFGHVIGLDHTCVGRDQKPALDNNGQPVVDCAHASREVQETTMYPSVASGDTARRDLAPDDKLAACTIYPAGSALPCVAPPDPVSKGGCTYARGNHVALPLLVVVLSGLVRFRYARRVRKTRARSSPPRPR